MERKAASQALERERRRIAAERDAEILACAGPDLKLSGLAEYAASSPPPEPDEPATTQSTSASSRV
jgi:hypothetical protein